MKVRSLQALSASCFLAAALIGSGVRAAPVQASTHKAYESILQAAFECRGVSPDIDLALQSRRIVLDGVTHTVLNPPITVLGFKVSDVTVFRDGGEDVYAVYLTGQGAAIAAAFSPDRFKVSSLPGGVTRLACSISTEPSDSDD